MRAAELLRNALAHSQQDLALGSTWQETIELVEWVEARLSTSDQRVEELVQAQGADDQRAELLASA